MWLGTYTDGPMRLDFYSEDGQFLTDVRTESTDLLRYDLWLLDLLETCVNEVQRLGLEEQQRWIGSFPCCPLACLAWVREARRTEGEVRVCRAMFCLGLGKMARPGGGGEQKAAELCQVLDLIRSRGETMEIIPSLRLVELGQELHEALAGPVEVWWTSN